MKVNFAKTILTLFIISIVAVSCNNEKNKVFEVKLKKDNNAEITYVDGTASVLVDKLIIGANNSDSDIQFSLDPNIATGTYTEGFLISHGVNGTSIFTTATNAQSSSLTISTHDKTSRHIVGTYSVTYTDNTNSDSHTATGSFDVIY